MRNFTFIIVIIICFTNSVNAQLVIGNPSLGFTQACAGPSFNTYNVTFTFTPPAALSPSNQFIIELSDATGSFASATTVFTSAAGAVITSPATLAFSLPQTTGGEAYRVRVKSTSPVATSGSSVAFAAYYKIQDSPFSINNLISTAQYCSGSSYLLTIDNPGTGTNDSPLKYPSLTFNWYKETSPTTSVFVASGSSLAVSEPGVYFVKTNYGSCTSDSYSNRVTVSMSTSGVTTSINSSLGNPYCAGDGATTLSCISGNSYQWFKNGTAITGATNQSYVTNEAGNYSVNVNLGSCSASGSIDLENNDITSSIDVSETNTIIDGESLIATVSTDAVSPDFKWYFNDGLIPEATSNSYEASVEGNYKVVITQTSGCAVSDEFLYSLTINEPFPDVAEIPNLISPNNDGINDTWIIPQAYVKDTNTEVVIMNSRGEVVFRTNNYLNNWPENPIDFKNINPVYYYIITTQNNTTKKGSITVVK
ncbi:gliding motility-associated C-terminal domain-containing protein [Mariniflexile aquimaris]|uniref:Gliding motility-associated C-terminal domain-containing protein n=1 Tax=Mariniflexile aquimaris TaxID=881009 RepID=A0ABW3BTU3_9FLAO